MAAHVDVLETRADQSLIAVPHFVKHVLKRCLQYQLFILHKSQRYVSLYEWSQTVNLLLPDFA
jgi:hypothetical protein